MRLIAVSKDNGDTKMLLPIAKKAMDLGHNVFIFAEGMGVVHYKQQQVKTFFRAAPNPDPHTSFDTEAVLEHLFPDAVLVGFPNPNENLSRTFALKAVELCVPVIGVEDYWGGVKRNLDIEYDMILTIDDYAAEIARGCLNSNVPVYVIGNHAIPGADYVSPPAVIEGIAYLREKFDKVFVYGGGNVPYTTEELKLLVLSLYKTHGDWCLVPRYHPNLKRQPAKGVDETKLWEEVWDEILAPLGNRVQRLDAGNSDDMAIACDGYFSSLGSSMNSSISRGVPTVAVITSATIDEMKKSKLENFPSVYLGGAQVLKEPTNVLPLLVKPTLEKQAMFKPLDARLALNLIRSFFKL